MMPSAYTITGQFVGFYTSPIQNMREEESGEV
jgi:hypothetical protein